MNRVFHGAMTVLLPVALLHAQDATDASAAKSEARVAFDKLSTEFGTARNAYYKQLSALDAAGNRRALNKYQRSSNPLPRFLEKFAEGALMNEGSEDAVPYLSWIVLNTPAKRGIGNTAQLAPQADEALSTLLSEHHQSPGLAKIAGRINSFRGALGKERYAEMVETFLANPSAKVQANTRWSQVSAVLSGYGSTAAEKEVAAKQARKIIADGHSDFTTIAKRTLYSFENIRIGKVAPDIDGEDLDGVGFKLSDYRGKVVVLDFWGDW